MKDAEAFVPEHVGKKLMDIYIEALSNPIFEEDLVGKQVMERVSQQTGINNKLATWKSIVVEAYTVIQSNYNKYILAAKS
jgi:hypothetical protein